MIDENQGRQVYGWPVRFRYEDFGPYLDVFEINGFSRKLFEMATKHRCNFQDSDDLYAYFGFSDQRSQQCFIDDLITYVHDQGFTDFLPEAINQLTFLGYEPTPKKA